MGVKGAVPALVLVACFAFAAVNAAESEAAGRKLMQNRRGGGGGHGGDSGSGGE